MTPKGLMKNSINGDQSYDLSGNCILEKTLEDKNITGKFTYSINNTPWSHISPHLNPLLSSNSSYFDPYSFQTLRSIMGVFTYEDEVTCSIPPAKMFKAAILGQPHS